MADTSLWPIVASGLLTGLFALGGIGVGLVGTARRDAAQERHEKAKRRADKFEELVAAVYEFDHWLESIRDREALGAHTVPPTASPFAKVQSISAVYFPQFSELIGELERASTQYRLWLLGAASISKQKDLANSFGEIFMEHFNPYMNKLDELLSALRKFARDEFQ